MYILPKRISLFALTNLAIIITISLLASLFGLPGMIEERFEVKYEVLLLICTAWGFTGAILSLLLSRWTAKKWMRISIISSQKQSNLQWLAISVEHLAKAAGLTAMPEVGVYRSTEANAFATGPSQRHALVAFSTALLESMDKEAIEGVAAHEIAHIKNGDMVTMTLLQGVLNSLIMFLAWIIAQLASSTVKDRAQSAVFHIVFFVSELILGLFGLMIAGAYSRHREFRADAESAKLAGSSKMIKALQYLKNIDVSEVEAESLPAPIAALGVSGKSTLKAIFSTHPPLDDRIMALKQITIR